MVCLDAVNVFNQEFSFLLVPMKMCMYILSVQRILLTQLNHVSSMKEMHGKQSLRSLL